MLTNLNETNKIKELIVKYLKGKTKMNEVKINTLHPLGKKNKSVPKQNYELFKKTIVNTLRKKQMTHTELVDQLTKTLKSKFPGNISWYTMVVKLDLEARGIIERTNSKPQKYRVNN
jgi:hypothetical protein